MGNEPDNSRPTGVVAQFLLVCAEDFFDILQQCHEVRWPVPGEVRLFEVYFYFLFRLDWAVCNERRPANERESLLSRCEDVVAVKAKTSFPGQDILPIMDNRYALYSRAVGKAEGKGWGQALEGATWRLEQLLIRFHSAESLEEEDLDPPVIGCGILEKIPLRSGIREADLQFGTRFEIGLRHLFSSCQDLSKASPELIEQYLAAGVDQAVGVIREVKRKEENRHA